MELKVLTLENMETIREWRNECMETLRTPYLLIKEMQEDWYKNVICNRNSNTRYWGLHIVEDVGGVHFDRPDLDGDHLIGYGGIENIQWENRIGEISILIGKAYRKQGYGKKAVDLFLDQAFHNLNFYTVWGECYYSSGACDFWKKIIKEKDAYSTQLPNRKYWDGHYWDSLYFSFERKI